MGFKNTVFVFLCLFCIVSIWIYFVWVSNKGLVVGDFIKKWPNSLREGTWFDHLLSSSKDTWRDRARQKYEIAERFERRYMHAKTLCERLNLKSKLASQNLSKLRFLEDQRMYYCPIEKVACTFWGKVFYVMNHRDNNKTITEVRALKSRSNKGNRRILKKYTMSYIDEHYKSFLFVRDPFTRLFSGWFDKLFVPNVMYWNTLGPRIKKTRGSKASQDSYTSRHIKRARRKASQSDSECGHDISFKEFVNFISRQIISGKKVDRHFIPSINHCNVCDMNFTFIGKYETMREDAKFIVDHFKDGDIVNIEKHIGHESLVMEIKDRARFLFSHRKGIERCMSFQCALYRCWQYLVGRGIIGRHIPFPYAEYAENVTEEQFATDVIEARARSDKMETAKNRNEVLVEAYKSLSEATFEQLVQAFSDDFDIFGYSKKPVFLQHGDQIISPQNRETENYKYLQDCPY